MKTRYFEPAIPLTNTELYSMVVKRIFLGEWNKARIDHISTNISEDGTKSSTYGIGYVEEFVKFTFYESESRPSIEISSRKTRNTNRLIAKLSRFLRLNKFGGLIEVVPESVGTTSV